MKKFLIYILPFAMLISFAAGCVYLKFISKPEGDDSISAIQNYKMDTDFDKYMVSSLDELMASYNYDLYSKYDVYHAADIFDPSKVKLNGVGGVTIDAKYYWNKEGYQCKVLDLYNVDADVEGVFWYNGGSGNSESTDDRLESGQKLYKLKDVIVKNQKYLEEEYFKAWEEKNIFPSEMSGHKFTYEAKINQASVYKKQDSISYRLVYDIVFDGYEYESNLLESMDGAAYHKIVVNADENGDVVSTDVIGEFGVDSYEKIDSYLNFEGALKKLTYNNPYAGKGWKIFIKNVSLTYRRNITSMPDMFTEVPEDITKKYGEDITGHTVEYNLVPCWRFYINSYYINPISKAEYVGYNGDKEWVVYVGLVDGNVTLERVY